MRKGWTNQYGNDVRFINFTGTSLMSKCINYLQTKVTNKEYNICLDIKPYVYIIIMGNKFFTNYILFDRGKDVSGPQVHLKANTFGCCITEFNEVDSSTE